MEKSHSASYAAAGVNIEAGYEGVRLMKKHVARTMIPGVVSLYSRHQRYGRTYLSNGY